MAKAELGEKRVCPECSSKFYDLTKRPAVCPKCGHSFNPEDLDPTNIPVPTAPLKSDTEVDEDIEEDEEEIDEEENEAKELELDGDDAAVIGGATDGDDDAHNPDFNSFDPDEDEDEDAALVDDDGDDLPPTGDEDDDEEIEI